MTFEYDLDELRRAPEPAGPPVRSRGRAWGVVLVLLGVAGLLAFVALPALAERAVRPPTGPRTGVPATWYEPAGPVPSVRDWHLQGAVLLLGDEGGERYLVSAGGKRYARVPLDSPDDLAALSDDGRLVGWLSQDGPDAGRLHVLRLADGREVSTVVRAAGFRPVALRWDVGSFQVSGWHTVPRDDDSPDFQATRDLSCWLAPVVSTPTRFAPAEAVLSRNGCGGTPVQAAAFGDADADGSYSLVHPAGGGREAWLQLDGGWTLAISASSFVDFDGAEAVSASLAADPPGARLTSARLLAWADAGVLVQTRARSADGRSSGALLLVDPSTLRQRALARGTGDLTPLAVAPGAVGYGTPVAAPPPSYPFWQPARVAELTGRVRDRYPALEFAAVALPLLLLGTGVVLLASPTRGSTIASSVQ